MPLDSSYEERTLIIKRLVNNGIHTDDCIGYHGTSIEAFNYYLRNGVIPGSTIKEEPDSPHLPQIGDLYFYPFDRTIVELKEAEERDFCTKEESLSSGIVIAEALARKHFVLGKLQIPLEMAGEYGYLDNLVIAPFPLWLPSGLPFLRNDYWKKPSVANPDYHDYHAVVDLLPKNGIKKLIKQSRFASGIVVGISRRVVDHKSLRFGDEGHDMRINIRQSSPSEAFSGITLMGKYESNWLSKL